MMAAALVYFVWFFNGCSAMAARTHAAAARRTDGWRVIKVWQQRPIIIYDGS